MDHCFIMTHSIHREGDILQIYFCAIFCETRCYAQVHITSGTLCAISLAVRRTRQCKWVGDFTGQCLLLQLLLGLAAAVVPLLLPLQNSLPHRYPPHLIPQVGIRNQNFTVGFLLKFYSFFPAIAQYPQSSDLFRLLCMTQHS